MVRGHRAGSPSTTAARTKRGPLVREEVAKRAGGLHFACLDGCRAFAASGVVLYHSTIAFSFFGGHRAPGWNAPLGDYAVCVFFVLSGFLLYRPFALAHRQGGDEPGWGSFWLRRVARIVPGYWLATAALLLCFASANAHVRGPLDVFTFFSFTQIYRSGYATRGLDVAWTLCIEFSFYLALPLLAAVGGGWRPARRPDHRLRRELGLLVGLFVIGVSYRLMLFDHTPWWAQRWLEPHYWLPYYIDWFALGMFLAVLHVWWEGRRLPRIIRIPADHPGICVALGAAGYLWLTSLNLPRSLALRGAASTRDTMLRFAIDGVSAFVLLLPAVFGDARVGWTRKVLTNRVVEYVGLVSFGVYLWHPMWIHQLEVWRRHKVFVPVDGTFQSHMVGWFPVSVPLAAACALALALVTASLSYWLVEKPVLDLLRRRQTGAAVIPRPTIRLPRRMKVAPVEP